VADEDDNQWHLDKKVPISIVIMLVVQTVTFAVLGTQKTTNMDNRISGLERDLSTLDAAIDKRLTAVYDANSKQEPRLIILEQQFQFIRESLVRIEKKLVDEDTLQLKRMQ
jgi:hypothetical protein